MATRDEYITKMHKFFRQVTLDLWFTWNKDEVKEIFSVFN
jgi:hypothetical protein